MNSYEYLLKTAALPAPLRQDPDLDDVVTWDTPGGHTVRHIYDAKRLAARRADLATQLAAVNARTDEYGQRVAEGLRSAKQVGHALLGGFGGAGVGLLGSVALGRHSPLRPEHAALAGGLAGAVYGGTRPVPLPKVHVTKNYTDPHYLAERGRVPVSALYGLSSQDRAAAAQRALARAQHEELQGLRDDMWHRDMRDQWAKHSNEDTGYSTAAPTSTTPRRTGIGAPALPPTPSAAPTTMAPPPSPKLGGLLDDIESTLRRRRLAGAAREAAMRQAEVQVRPQLERYQATRNKTLKSLGLHGLGAGLGGLALYGAGRYALERASSPPAEDYAASYG